MWNVNVATPKRSRSPRDRRPRGQPAANSVVPDFPVWGPLHPLTNYLRPPKPLPMWVLSTETYPARN